MSNPAAVIQQFSEALMREDYLAARNLLGEPFSFVGWFDRFDHPDAYINALRKLRGFITRNDFRKIFVDGGDVCLIYDAHTVRGDAAPVAAWFTVHEGQITAVRIICDSRPFAEVWRKKPS